MNAMITNILIFGLILLLAACEGSQSSPSSEDADLSEREDSSTADADVSNDDDSSAPLCEENHGPVPPVDTNDVVHDTVHPFPCLDGKCFCSNAAEASLERMLQCDAVQVGYFWDFGETSLRVSGREAGHCVIDITAEEEGGVSLYRCRLPLPVMPWLGLTSSTESRNPPDIVDGIEERCELIGQCVGIIDHDCDDLEISFCDPGLGSLPCDEG